MSRFSRKDALSLMAILQEAGMRCQERCLYQSAKWVLELAGTLEHHFEDGDEPPAHIPSSVCPDAAEAKLEARELQRFLLAKSYFDCREFDRCSAVFLKTGLPSTPLAKGASSVVFASAPKSSSQGSWKGKGRPSFESSQGSHGASLQQELSGMSQKALFLALYAKYLSGEKRKDEESEMILGPADRGSAVNGNLVGITQALEAYFAARQPDQYSSGWLEYLYGVALAKGKSEAAARRWLIRSILIYPYNWGAWQELNGLLGSVEELREVLAELQPNVMALIFNIFASIELHQVADDVYQQLAKLEEVFPGSAFLQTQKALLCYNNKDFEEAEGIFSHVVSADPHRLDSLDHYSNILYVMDLRPKLAFLAALASATDKFRPETCCVVGNYYSMKSEHEKAVQYFRRALQLDRTFLSAWTLMGHEFVEMKNTHAAIEAYRRAVDVNRKDYRAWYGLGQTYEVLEMHLYALFYFQRAAALRPYEAKMWHAVGSCCDKVGRPLQGIRAYKRALMAGGAGGNEVGSTSFGSAASAAAPDSFMIVETLFAIASMYEKLGERDKAARYMEMTLAQEDGNAAAMADDDDIQDKIDDPDDPAAAGTGVTQTTSRARMWLARWEAQRGNLQRAMRLAHELCQDSFEVEEAKALIRDIRARVDAPAGGGG